MRTAPQTSPPPHNAPAADAFETGVLEFAGRLRSFIRARVRNTDDADDLAQDVLVKVFRSRAALRDPRRLDAWIYRTARTTVTDYHRRRRIADALPDSLADDTAPFDEVGARLRTSVKRFVATLPPLYREPLELAEFEGASVSVIAARLGLSASAVKSRLSRGRALLRERLLACCQFEFDPFGKIIDLRRRGPCACESDCEDTAPPLPQGVIAFDLAVEAEAAAIRALLEASSLPTADLTAAHLLNFIVAREGDRVVGCAGLEPHGTSGLIRSVAVASTHRGRGIGERLVRGIDLVAAMFAVKELFLLTTTAAPFFARLGYAPLDRARAPRAIRATKEFGSLCPDSAVLMRKAVAAGSRSKRARQPT